MKSKDAPNVLPALEEKITDKDAEKHDMNKLGLKEFNNPVWLKNVDVL